MYDAIVVGGGVSGLTSALLLAHFGQRVAVVERAAQIGHLLRGFDRWGVHFDTGFHYAGGMAEGEGVRRFFKFLGLDDQLNILPMHQQCFDHIISSDKSLHLQLPVGPRNFIHTLSVEFPAQRQAIEGFVADIMHVGDNLPYLNLATAVSDTSVFAIADDVSLQQYLHALTPDSRLRKILALHCVLHGVPAALVPFRFHASVIGPYLRSSSTLDGGGASLIAALEHQLQLSGVDVFCGQHVQKFQLGVQDEITGVELDDGQILQAKTVVSTIHPSAMVNCLPARVLRPIYRKRLYGVKETNSASLLFARCRQPVELLHGSNIYLFDFNKPTEQGFPFDNNLCYLTAANGINSSGFMAIVPTTMEPFTQWSDSSCGHRPPEYYVYKKQLVNEILNNFCTALPQLTDQVDRCELATPLTLRDYMYSPDGALYGAQRQVGHYPLQATTRVAGLYLSGQALVAPGVMGAMISAFNTCGTMVGQERLLGELKLCN